MFGWNCGVRFLHLYIVSEVNFRLQATVIPAKWPAKVFTDRICLFGLKDRTPLFYRINQTITALKSGIK